MSSIAAVCWGKRCDRSGWEKGRGKRWKKQKGERTRLRHAVALSPFFYSFCDYFFPSGTRRVSVRALDLRCGLGAERCRCRGRPASWAPLGFARRRRRKEGQRHRGFTPSGKSTAYQKKKKEKKTPKPFHPSVALRSQFARRESPGLEKCCPPHIQPLPFTDTALFPGQKHK